MHGVAATEQHQIPLFHRQRLYRSFTVQHLRNPGVIHLAAVGIAQVFHIFKASTGLRFLDQQRDGERRVVEMPTQFLPAMGIVQIDRRQAIGVGIQTLFFQHRAEKIAERLRVIQCAQR
ncbi:hypothetical protein D3C75_1026050 [compost metagenome]